MPLDATAPALDALLLGTALEMELSDRDLQVAQKRYHLIPDHLQRPSSSVRQFMDNARVYAQGSRAIGATIVHGSSDDRFDLDAILEFPTPSGWSPRRVLDELEVAFQGFPDVRQIVRCTRCIQLQFAFMHLDVTPMNPFSEPRPQRAGEIYHSPDRGLDKLYRVNPFAFAEWFKKQVIMPSPQFLNLVRNMRSRTSVPDRIVRGTVLAEAEIDKLPAPVNPLRDAPQVISLKLMKRFLNLSYADRDMKRPVSVYLSKIAVMVPLNPQGLCAQLESFASELERRMIHAFVNDRRPNECNPDFPEENFNDRWPKDIKDVMVFKDDLRHLLKELERARRSEFSEIKNIFDKLFGERVTDKAVRKYLDSLSGVASASSYERGQGFVAAPSLLAPTSTAAAPVSRAPAHHFHTGLTEK